ncbi:MAG: imidazole glycerol phosphate synthase subunit HisH [Candidatus Margulisiibacteriota bacterium]
MHPPNLPKVVMPNSSKVVMIDYGAGNLASVHHMVLRVGYDMVVSADPAVVEAADVVVFPGQGAFGEAMAALNRTGLSDVLRRHLQAEKPYLGICLGLQLLFEGSEEAPGVPGLGVFPGQVKRFSMLPKALKIPHMGWNAVEATNPNNPMFEGVDQGYFYFVHSYYVPELSDSLMAATTTYGHRFTSAIQTESVLAVQFHPEKSSDNGHRLLTSFFNHSLGRI